MANAAAESLIDRVYVEQVRSLYLNMTPTALMALIFLINVTAAARIGIDASLWLIGIAGTVANVARLGVAAWFRERALTAALDRAAAHRLEILFSLPYLAFALCLGVLALWVFARDAPQLHMLTSCVVVGYCAGVATNCGLRPYLAVPSILLAVGPAILSAAFHDDFAYAGMAISASGFLLGAWRSILVRYESSKAEIGQRLASVSLARRDALTALPNRLALQEVFEENLDLVSDYGVVAAHYLDLNGFKRVNDEHGHAIGDALLQAVADRLSAAVRSGDIVARLGGDEFAVIQFGLRHPDEAQLLARRISASIDQPFEIEGLNLGISTCIGTIVSHGRVPSLDWLLRGADAKLYEAKREKVYHDRLPMAG